MWFEIWDMVYIFVPGLSKQFAQNYTQYSHGSVCGKITETNASSLKASGIHGVVFCLFMCCHYSAHHFNP
jgi:hypothetical protein